MQLSSRRSLGGSTLLGGTENEPPVVVVAAKPPKNKRYSSAFELKATNSPKTNEEKKKQQVVAELYQDVVKRVQENKLTAKNAFGSRNIIDNLDVVLQLAKGSFHKASCAVSTAAEVYCLEVDDLCATTSLVQEMLFNSDNKRGEMDGEDARASRKKTEGTTTSSAASTLETNLANIRSDQVEAELEVDAQFQKLLQGKETGAQGMLLNILGVYNGPNMALDSTGVPAFPSDENDQLPNVMELPREISLKTPKFLEFRIGSGLVGLREELAKRTSQEVVPNSNSVVESMDPRISFGSLERRSVDEGKLPVPVSETGNASTPISSEGQMEDYEYEDYGDADGGEYYDNDYGAEPFVGAPSSSFNSSTNHSFEQPNALPLIMKAFENQAMEADSAKIEYFEAPDLHESLNEGPEVALTGGKYWLGDMHWKAPRMKVVADPATTLTTKKRKSAKDANRIDFFAVPIDEKTIFARPATARSNQLPKSTFTKASSFLLPRNTHFTVAELSKLFIRPSSTFKPITTRLVPGSSVAGLEPYNYDDVGGDYGNDYDDDDDDNGFYDCASGRSSSSPLRNLVAPAHHVERIRVAFATRAKKVDVKKLKSDLWETIDALTSAAQNEKEEEKREINGDEESGGHVDSESSANVSLVGSIKTLAPKASNDNITVPFYFICMLHLANEKGLELQSSSSLDDVEIFKTC